MNNVVKNSKTSPKKSVTAKQQAKSNLTKRKNPDWDNLDRGYRYLTQDMKLPHDQAVAVMGNVVEESQGDYKAAQKNGGGRGLIQWDGRKTPNGRYSQWGSIWASVAKPANVYDSTTDTVKNYWAPWGGLKGDKVRQKFIKAPLKEKARIYAESYLRPGKPRIADRQLSAMQLDSIYNPRIKNIMVQKDGGMLEFLKNGSGIHIKEKNKGSFTRWCGGNVTEECIRRGKASSNPKIRKKATFADNARHFKHRKGGKVFVSGVNVLDSNPKAYKQVKKKYKMQYGGYIPEIINASPVVQQHYLWQLANQDYMKQKEDQKLEEELIEQQKKNKRLDTISRIGSALINNIPGIISGVKDFTKKNAPTTNNTSNLNLNWNGTWSYKSPLFGSTKNSNIQLNSPIFNPDFIQTNFNQSIFK